MLFLQTDISSRTVPHPVLIRLMDEINVVMDNWSWQTRENVHKFSVSGGHGKLGNKSLHKKIGHKLQSSSCKHLYKLWSEQFKWLFCTGKINLWTWHLWLFFYILHKNVKNTWRLLILKYRKSNIVESRHWFGNELSRGRCWSVCEFFHRNKLRWKSLSLCTGWTPSGGVLDPDKWEISSNTWDNRTF